MRAALAPYSSQSSASQAEATSAEGAQSDAAAGDEPAPNASQNTEHQAPASQGPAPQSSSTQGPAPRSRRKRLTPEQIRAKTRRVGLVLGADVTAQSAIALTLANVARRRRAQGKASRKFSVAAALFALNATVESALIPTVLRSFEQTQLKKHARPVADAELVHPGIPPVSSPRPSALSLMTYVRATTARWRMPPRPWSRHPLDCVSVPWV